MKSKFATQVHKTFPPRDFPTEMKHGENTLPPFDCGQCQIEGCTNVAEFQCFTRMPEINDPQRPQSRMNLVAVNCDRFICDEHAVEQKWRDTNM